MPGYIPLMMRFDRPVLVLGSGRVAMRKMRTIAPHVDDITVFADSRPSGPLPGNARFMRVALNALVLENIVDDRWGLVISALDDAELNAVVANLCMRARIPVNVADDVGLSSCIFPAAAREGDLTVAVSTSGRCPYLAVSLRDELRPLVRTNSRVLDILADARRSADIDVLREIYSDKGFRSAVQKGDWTEAERTAGAILERHRSER